MSLRDHVVRLFASLAYVLALVWGLTGCAEDAPTRDDDEGDGGPVADAGARPDAAPALACPAGWVEAEVGCVPRGADVEGCGPDRLTLADGTCGSAWVCPDGWARAPGRVECRPPEPAECPEGSFWVPGGEGCTEARPCPEGWMRAYGGCMPAPLAPCDGEPLPGGGCLNLPPVQARGCDGVEGLPAPGAACRPLPVDGCSDGPFEAGAWPAGTVFVRAGAADGDGSAEQPFGTLDAALATVAPEGVVALGPGRYPAPTLTGTLTLRGRCARDVVLEGVLTVRGDASVDVGDLSVEGDLDVEVSATATVSRVQVEGSADRPAVRIGGAVEATGLRVSGAGEGLVVQADGVLRCQDCVVDGTREFGILVEPDGDAVLRDTVVLRVSPIGYDAGAVDIRGTLDVLGMAVLNDPAADQDELSAAIRVEEARATLRQLRLTGAVFGLGLRDSTVTADDLDIAGVRTSSIAVSNGQVSGSRWRITGHAGGLAGALQATSRGAIDVSDLWIETLGNPLVLRFGALTVRGAFIRSQQPAIAEAVSSTLDLERVRVENAEILSTAAGRPDSSVRLSDVDVRGASLFLAGPDGTYRLERVAVRQPPFDRYGLVAYIGAFYLRDLFVETRTLGLSTYAAQADVAGVTIRMAAPAGDAAGGAGTAAFIRDTGGTVAHVAVSGVAKHGLWVTYNEEVEPRPSLQLRDVHIDASPADAPDAEAVGVWVDAADADFERLRVTGVAGPGLAVTRGAHVTARRVALHDTGAAGEDGAGPAGLLVAGDSSATLEDLDVRRAVGTGVTVDGGRLSLDRVQVAELTARAGGPPASAVLTVGGEVDLTNATLTTEVGPAVITRGGGLTLHDAALEGGGVAALDGATVDAERVAVGGAGALLAAEASTVTARDVLAAGGGVAAL